MRFALRALTGFAIAALTAALVLIGGAPFFACAPGVGPLFGDRCVLTPKPGPDRRARGGDAAAPVVRVVPLTRASAPMSTRALGTLQEGRAIELRSEAAGRVVALGDSVEDGAFLEAGALVFRIDPSELEAAVADAAAALAEAEAEAAEAVRALRFAEAELEAAIEQRGLREKALARQTGLEQRGFSTEAALEETRLQLAEAERAVITRDSARVAAEKRVAQSEQAEKRAAIVLGEARRSLDDAELRAPFNGLLERPNVELGRLVSVNESLGVLLELSSMEAAFRAPDRVFGGFIDAAGALKPLPVTVSLALGDRRISGSGHLARVGARSAPGEGGRLVYAALDLDPRTPFRPGDLVEIVVEEPPLPNAIRLPAEAVALRRIGAGAATVGADAATVGVDGTPGALGSGVATSPGALGEIMTLDDDNRLRPVPVRILRRDGPDIWVAEAASGAGPDARLPAGALIVVERNPALGAGALVRPVGHDGARIGGGEAVDGGEAATGGSGAPGEPARKGAGGARPPRGGPAVRVDTRG